MNASCILVPVQLLSVRDGLWASFAAHAWIPNVRNMQLTRGTLKGCSLKKKSSLWKTASTHESWRKFFVKKKQKFCCCCWICCEDSKYVVLKIRQSSSSWRIGFLSVLASRSYHAARSPRCISPRRGWAGFPRPQRPRKKRIWLAGSLSWSGWPALYHWSASARCSLLSLRPSTPSSPPCHPPSQDYKPLEVWALHLCTCQERPPSRILPSTAGLTPQSPRTSLAATSSSPSFQPIVGHLLIQKEFYVLLCPGLPCDCCSCCFWLYGLSAPRSLYQTFVFLEESESGIVTSLVLHVYVRRQ